MPEQLDYNEIKTELAGLFEEKLRANGTDTLQITSNPRRLLNAPILIIGLGGTGRDALLRIKHHLSIKMGITEANKPANLEYLAIDTDRESANESYKTTTLNVGNAEFCIINDPNLAETYNAALSDADAYPYAHSWLQDGIGVTDIKYGAGGVRQIGRLLLFTQFTTVYGTLLNKINNIRTAVPNTKIDPLVFILTGVSGGTGSGTFIDIAYMVRTMFDEVHRPPAIYGFMFLPDVNIAKLHFSRDESIISYCRVNGFAALKELDYVMNFGRQGNKDYYKQKFSAKFTATSAHQGDNVPPFTLCHLVSSKKADGNSSTYDACMISAAEMILNFIAGESANGNHTIKSYTANAARMISAFKDGLQSEKQAVNYKYTVIGTSVFSINTEAIMAYLAHEMFNKFHEMLTNPPSDDDISDYVNRLGIDSGTVYNALRGAIEFNLPLPNRYSDYRNYTGRIIQERCEAEFVRVETGIRANADGLIAGFTTALREKVKESFQNLNQGPFYTKRLLYQERPVNSLYNECEKHKEEMTSDVSVSFEEFRQAQKDFDDTFVKSFNYGKLLTAYRKYYDELVKDCVKKHGRRVYDELVKIIIEENNSVFDLAAAIFIDLKGIFSDNRIGHYNAFFDGTTLTYELIEKGKLIPAVKNFVEAADDGVFADILSNKAMAFIGNLIEWTFRYKDEVYRNRNEIVIEPGRIGDEVRSRLNSFIEHDFSKLLRKNVDDFLLITEGSVTLAKAKAVELLESAKSRAEVLFVKSRIGKAITQYPAYEYFAYPMNSNYFDAAVTAVFGATKNKEKKASTILNTIYFLNAEFGVPLAGYGELEGYENAYNNSTMPGKHLYYSTNENGKNWYSLPSPIPHDNSLVFGYYDRALQYGHFIEKITRDSNGHDVRIVNAKIVTDFSLTPPNDELSAAERVTVWQEILNNFLSLRMDEVFYDTKLMYTIRDNQPELLKGANGENIIDDAYQKAILVNSPVLYKKLKTTIDMYERICSELEKSKEDADNEAEKVIISSQFIKALVTEQLLYAPTEYYYTRLTKTFGKHIGTEDTLWNINDYSGLDGSYKEYYAVKAFISLKSSDVDEFKLQVSKINEIYKEKTSKVANSSDKDAVKHALKAVYEDFKNAYGKLGRHDTRINDKAIMLDVYDCLLSEARKLAVNMGCDEWE